MDLGEFVICRRQITTSPIHYITGRVRRFPRSLWELWKTRSGRFPRTLWTRSGRPQVRQLPQAGSRRLRISRYCGHAKKNTLANTRRQIVARVRRGASLRAVARSARVTLDTVQRWVARAAGRRLDRVAWHDRPPIAHPIHRTDRKTEDLILALRRELKQQSALGEFGAVRAHRARPGASRRLRVPRFRARGISTCKRRSTEASSSCAAHPNAAPSGCWGTRSASIHTGVIGSFAAISRWMSSTSVFTPCVGPSLTRNRCCARSPISFPFGGSKSDREALSPVTKVNRPGFSGELVS